MLPRAYFGILCCGRCYLLRQRSLRVPFDLKIVFDEHCAPPPFPLAPTYLAATRLSPPAVLFFENHH